MNDRYGIDVVGGWGRVRPVCDVVWVVSTKFHPSLPSLFFFIKSDIYCTLTDQLAFSRSILSSSVSEGPGLGEGMGSGWEPSVVDLGPISLPLPLPFPLPLTFFLFEGSSSP